MTGINRSMDFAKIQYIVENVSILNSAKLEMVYLLARTNSDATRQQAALSK